MLHYQNDPLNLAQIKRRKQNLNLKYYYCTIYGERKWGWKTQTEMRSLDIHSRKRGRRKPKMVKNLVKSQMQPHHAMSEEVCTRFVILLVVLINNEELGKKTKTKNIDLKNSSKTLEERNIRTYTSWQSWLAEENNVFINWRTRCQNMGVWKPSIKCDFGLWSWTDPPVPQTLEVVLRS